MDLTNISNKGIIKGMESIILTGLIENAHITKITADKAHLIVNPILKSLSHKSTFHTVKEFIKRIDKGELIMTRNSVSSSLINSIGYDEESKTLELEFNNGKVYQYLNVPQETYQNMIDSFSIGKFFYQHIKGVFDYVKM